MKTNDSTSAPLTSSGLAVTNGSVQGFWRSARGENHGRDSRLGDVWVSPGDITDSDRLRWLHTGGGKDADGFEWGIFRVKWENGVPVSVLHTLSDMSDLDAEILRESAASQNK